MKISGEALMGDKKFGHDINVIKRIAKDVKEVQDLGLSICIVVGGGNICRGVEASMFGMERAGADYIGMIATVINALAIQNVMEGMGMLTRVLSAIDMTKICEPYIKRRAQNHIDKGRVVIFAAGTGNPFFTTDSAAVLRAIEMNCDVLVKASQVDGVYCSDPKNNPNARRYTSVSYQEVITQQLNVMDMSAVALARENNLLIKICSIKEVGNLAKVLKDEGKYTEIVNK